MIDKMVTCPCVTEQGKTLWFSMGDDAESTIIKATRDRLTDPFSNYQILKINGKPVRGKCPRYVEATGELFYCAPNKSVENGTWELAVTQVK